MKKYTKLAYTLLIGAVSLSLSACDDEPAAPNPPVADPPVLHPDIDECPRKDGLACF